MNRLMKVFGSLTTYKVVDLPKTLWVVMFAISFMLCSCGGDDDVSEPSPDLTGLQADIDKKFDAIQQEINTLRADVAKGGVIPEGAVPVHPGQTAADVHRDQIRDQTGGVPPTGEPIGEAVADPFLGVPVIGEGRIVFTEGNGIYIVDSQGGRKTLVVQPEVSCRNPALSPDGMNIAYTAARDPDGAGRSPTYIRHIESGREFRLTDGDGEYPAWSPDGAQIVYGSADLYISTVDPFNPEVIRITHDGSRNTTATWSPDGKQIAFSSNLDGNPNIFAINPDGTNRIRFTNHPADDRHPDWSPDGNHIAFMTHRHGTWDIYLVNTKTFVETQLTDSQGNYQQPSWSPDGTKIALANNNDGEIYVINADGTNLTNITNSPTHEDSPDWH